MVNRTIVDNKSRRWRQQISYSDCFRVGRIDLSAGELMANSAVDGCDVDEILRPNRERKQK